ncbi:MAG: hypothetical protein ABI477_21095 [Chryseolinea sp.]
MQAVIGETTKQDRPSIEAATKADELDGSHTRVQNVRIKTGRSRQVECKSAQREWTKRERIHPAQPLDQIENLPALQDITFNQRSRLSTASNTTG